MLGAIHQIGEPCQSTFNAGFLTHLYLLRTEDVVYVYAPTATSIFQPAQAIGIQPGSVITRFLIRAKTAVFTETSTESPDGVAYQMNLAFPMKGTAANLTTWIHQNGKRRYVILARDTLGNCYLIGSADNGLRMGWTRQVGPQSMHQLSFTVTSWHPAQFIATIDVEEIFPDQEFDYSFDLSFS